MTAIKSVDTLLEKTRHGEIKYEIGKLKKNNNLRFNR